MPRFRFQLSGRASVITGVLVLLACQPGSLPSAIAQAPATSSDELQAIVDSHINGFRGDVGVFVFHLPTGRSAERNADVLFPSASLIKVAILVNAFDRVEKGLLDLEASYPFRDTLRTAGAGLLAGFRDGEPVKVSEMLDLMTAASDNTAALWVQQLSGSGDAVNEWLVRNGFEQTRVNAGTPGRKKQWRQFNWGQTTPREIARLFLMIRNGEAVSVEASAQMQRLLSRSFLDDEGLAPIPSNVSVMSKQATVERSRSEVLLVFAPEGEYIAAILTKNIRDVSWERDNEAFALIRNLSDALWKHFSADTAAHSGE